MSSITIGLIVLSCVFGGALLGFLLHAVLPHHHLSSIKEPKLLLNDNNAGKPQGIHLMIGRRPPMRRSATPPVSSSSGGRLYSPGRAGRTGHGAR